MELAAKKVSKSVRNNVRILVPRKRAAKKAHSSPQSFRQFGGQKRTAVKEVTPTANARLEVQSLASLRKRQSQEEMIEAHMPLVRMVAEKIHRRLPPGVDLGSLIHSGIVGLLEALQRYDSHRGVAFQTYARYRIQGEIMEYLRSLDWVSRSVRAWGRKIAVARIRLAGRLGREAVPEEMAMELGVPLQEYYRVDQKVSEATLLSLEDLSAASEEEWKKAQEEINQHPFQDPFAAVEGKDLVEKLTVAIEQLPERERLVVTLYYHEELTLREIGEILGLTEGRICQIHSQAVSHLQKALGLEEERPLAERRTITLMEETRHAA